MIGQNLFKAGNVDIKKAIYEKCLQKKKHEIKEDFQNLEYID